jgi:hypothetical protein
MARRPNFAEVVSKSNVGYGILRSRGAAEGHASRGIHAFELVLLLLLVFVVLFAALARKLLTPYPIVLVTAGLFLSFIPCIPKITLNPDVIFWLYCRRFSKTERGSRRGANSNLIL